MSNRVKTQMKKNNIYLLLILILNYSGNAQSNESIKRSKRISSSEAYGYLLGQEFTIQKIKSQLPQYELEIIAAELLMKTSFGKSKENLTNYFKTNLDENKFAELEAFINENFKKSALNFSYCEQDAKNLIIEIKDRSLGKIPSPVLETLLSFQYLDNPKDEFLAGYINFYSTKNHRKAKNTEWSIKVPKSWTANEGDGSNVIQKFINDCDSGNNIITMITQELPNEKLHKKLNSKDKVKIYPTDFFIEKNIKNFVPNGAKFLSFKPMKIANCPGGLIIYETEQERLGFKFKMRAFQFILQKNNYLHFLLCTIGTPTIEEDLNIKQKIYFPLYQLIANSIKTTENNDDIIYLKGNKNKKTATITINSTTYDFILDTGASVSLISKDIINSLTQDKIITMKNFVKKDYVKLADGKSLLVEFWKLPSIIIGSKKITDITFAVIGDNNLSMLLGMNILNQLDIWKIDLENNKIYLLK